MVVVVHLPRIFLLFILLTVGMRVLNQAYTDQEPISLYKLQSLLMTLWFCFWNSFKKKFYRKFLLLFFTSNLHQNFQFLSFFTFPHLFIFSQSKHDLLSNPLMASSILIHLLNKCVVLFVYKGKDHLLRNLGPEMYNSFHFCKIVYSLSIFSTLSLVILSLVLIVFAF